VKLPWQCEPVLLRKICRTQGKALGSVEVNSIKYVGERVNSWEVTKVSLNNMLERR
jgi:hypothetical protein